jgi:hypothetical protein
MAFPEGFAPGASAAKPFAGRREMLYICAQHL